MRVDAGECHQFIDQWNAQFEGCDEDNLNHRDRLLLEMKNPLQFGFSPEMTVNGKVLKRKTGSGICFIPGDPSESETRFIAEHYHLDLSFAWSFTRACFPWKSTHQPEIKSLKLTMIQEPVKVPGAVFEVSAPGQQINLNIPGHPFTLTVEKQSNEVLDAAMMSTENMEYPTCYSMLTYTLTPTPEPGTLYIQDLAECDQPRPKKNETTQCGSCEAAAIAIIGGADGPAAIIVGAPETKKTLAACSAPHFEPAEKIQWYPVLRVTEYSPMEIKLL